MEIEVIKEEKCTLTDVLTKTTGKKYLWGLIDRTRTVVLENPYSVGGVVLIANNAAPGMVFIDTFGELWRCYQPNKLRNVKMKFFSLYKTPTILRYTGSVYSEGQNGFYK